MNFDFNVLLDQKDAILQGVLTTVLIAMVSTVFSILLGLLTAIGQKLHFKPLRWALRGYVQFFRNTPLLVQIYFFYKALPYLGVVLSPISCGVIALSLQTGAYMAEIFRAGIESIPREQYEGGRSLGFTRFETYLRIIMPQALGIILPPLGNQVVGLVKNTSLVAFITVPDLFYVVFNGAASQFRYIEFFTLGVVLYMALTLSVSLLFTLIETQVPLLKRLRQFKYA